MSEIKHRNFILQTMINLCALSLMIFSISCDDVNAFSDKDSSVNADRGSCKVRSIRNAVDPATGSSMMESFVLDDIEYKLCRYHVTWDEALVFCSTHKAHLATLDDDEKISFVVRAIASSSFVSEDYWIGARKYYESFWTWESNSKELTSKFDVADNFPIFYPGEEINDLYCLTIDRNGHDVPIFVPRSCNQPRGFICQRDNERTFDNKIRMVAASRIGEQEFRLYSGRATWAEAVVQCRQEGLQIAEVKTIDEARTLAVSMLRNRPEGIESAWIGGYTRGNDPGNWRWLASGQKIKNNEMWRRNLSELSGGCLLLDRHLCEIPVYVETTCDRKRDVLCQKPPKRASIKKPVQAFVEGCTYWIGFYPMKWSDARKSCDSINASLVVLDSPKTISHMMRLMLDNRAELRHIWTDGNRALKNGRWEWEVNGEAVPALGEAFVPWCPDDTNYVNGTNCLNLDRENLDSPLVYGLSCNEKQSYICQPRIADCFSNATSASARRTDIAGSETTIEMKSFAPPGSPTAIDSYRQSLDTEDPELYPTRNLKDWQSSEDVSLENSSGRRNFSRYLNPLPLFTLPSFPQFGIKTASAMETLRKLPSLSTPETLNDNSRMDSKKITLTGTTTRDTENSMDKDGRTRKTTRRLNTNFTKVTTITTESSDLNYATNKINPDNLYTPTKSIPKNIIPPNYLRRITTALPFRRRKISFTTEFTTPYDIIDEDYYENYETLENTEDTRGLDPENVDDEDDYAPTYSTVKRKNNIESSTRISLTTTLSGSNRRGKKIDDKEKPSIPIAREISKNLQTALMNMIMMRMEKKKSQTTPETPRSTKNLWSDGIDVSRKNRPTEKPSRRKTHQENWSIHPYYAFEGPMIVGLSEDTSSDEYSDKANEPAKTHDFTFIRATKLDSWTKNENSEIPAYREHRRNNPSNPASIDDRKFQEYPKRERYEKTRWPKARFRGNRIRERFAKNRGHSMNENEKLGRNRPRFQNPKINSNYYEPGRRLYPRSGDNDFPYPQKHVQSLQEKLLASWPEITSTHSIVTYGEKVVSGKHSPASIRTTRSLNNHSMFRNHPSKTGLQIMDYFF